MAVWDNNGSWLIEPLGVCFQVFHHHHGLFPNGPSGAHLARCGRRHERRATHGRLVVHLGATVRAQRGDGVHVARLRRPQQRRVAALGLVVDEGAVLHQRVDAHGVALLARQRQRRVLRGVLQVR